MASEQLHLISFNVPYPPDYGGIIDIFYKIKALKEAGVQVILHCYTYGRQPSKELADLCSRVHYYPREAGPRYFLQRDPYITVTRNANTMPGNILGDKFPVLFEGLHSTALLARCAAEGKTTLVRTHNIEHRYYRGLARSETRWTSKVFLYTEAVKLKRYEQVLQHASHILAISKSEAAYFRERFGHTHFIPAFHRFTEVSCMPGKGDYVLFHGNLGVAENSDVLIRMTRNALSRTDHRVIVAGKNPPARLLRLLAPVRNIEVRGDPTGEEMDDLIRNAQVNLLFSSQSTGIKLKLLHALHAGRHCLVNREMIEGTGLAPLCTVASRPEEVIAGLETLMDQPFTESLAEERRSALAEYSNMESARRIIRLLP